MEENGRVTVKRVERPDGMTEYSLEYIPPIMISDGKYLKEERLNMATYTKVSGQFPDLSPLHQGASGRGNCETGEIGFDYRTKAVSSHVLIAFVYATKDAPIFELFLQLCRDGSSGRRQNSAHTMT